MSRPGAATAAAAARAAAAAGGGRAAMVASTRLARAAAAAACAACGLTGGSRRGQPRAADSWGPDARACNAAASVPQAGIQAGRHGFCCVCLSHARAGIEQGAIPASAAGVHPADHARGLDVAQQSPRPRVSSERRQQPGAHKAYHPSRHAFQQRKCTGYRQSVARTRLIWVDAAGPRPATWHNGGGVLWLPAGLRPCGWQPTGREPLRPGAGGDHERPWGALCVL